MNAQLIWPYYQILVGTGTIIIAIAAVMMAWTVYQARPQSINQMFRDYLRGRFRTESSKFFILNRHCIDCEKILYYVHYEITDAGLWQIEITFLSNTTLKLNFNSLEDFDEALDQLDQIVGVQKS